MAAAGGNPAALNASLVEGFHSAFIIAAFLAITASLIAFVGLTSKKLSREDLKHEAEGFPVVPGV